MRRAPLKQEYSISFARVISWLSGAAFVALGGCSIYLGTAEAPGVASFVGSVFGYLSVCHGVSQLRKPLEEADISMHDPRKETQDHILWAVLLL